MSSARVLVRWQKAGKVGLANCIGLRLLRQNCNAIDVLVVSVHRLDPRSGLPRPWGTMKNQVAGNIVSFGPFRLVASERLLTKNDETVPLGGRALDILITLTEQAGSVVSTEELISSVWPDVTVEEVNVRVHVANLRKALGDGRDGARYIINVPGRGYCFVAPVHTSALRYSPSTTTTVAQGANTLPPSLQRMLGREDLVKALARKVATHRIVSIVGPGGMGKTTVAIAVAHLLADDFEDGVFFIDLSPLQDPSLVIPTVAAAVGCLDQTQDSLTRLSTYLAEKRLLLVLDCCEHVIDPVATLADRLFIQGPSVHIAATSREALRVEGENIHLLLPLDSPPSGVELTAAGALETPAAQLFMDRAQAGGYRYELSDDAAPAVAEYAAFSTGSLLRSNWWPAGPAPMASRD